MPVPVHNFGGTGPALHMAVANGFPPQTYRPLLEPLIRTHRAVSLLPRPLWDDPPSPDSFRSWRTLADDLLTGLREHGLENVVAMGHSLGAVCSIMAILTEPWRFRALVLLDPTILHPAYLGLLRVMNRLKLNGRYPLVRKALRRRARFISVDEAFTYWRRKPLFEGWPDDTLRLYAGSITQPSPGGGVELKWQPAWEARVYQTIPTDTWTLVPRLRGMLPVLVIRGEKTNTFVEASARRLHHLLPEAALHTISGHGHFFPHTAPAEAARLIADWLADLPADKPEAPQQD